jgi:hypothetical protein
MKTMIQIPLFFLLFLMAAPLGYAADQEKEIRDLAKLNLKELTARSQPLVAKKYGDENWGKYKFPKFVYINDSVLLGYKIAVKEHQLLAHFTCYCFCEEMGHKNLSYCFLKNGTLGKFDDHAANCNVCVAQTMHAFLMNELGIPIPRIKSTLKKIYAEP